MRGKAEDGERGKLRFGLGNIGELLSEMGIAVRSLDRYEKRPVL